MGVEQEQVVLRFLSYGKGHQLDIEGMVGLMSEDIVWQVNVPWAPHIGRDAVRAELERQDAMATGSLPGSEIRSVASNDHQVFVERFDLFEISRNKITLHVNAVLEVDDGKIVAWREYFDSADLASQLGIDGRHTAP